MKRNLIFLVFACLISVTGYSQDIIVRKNGDKVICKIQREDSTAVFFKVKKGGQEISTYLKKDQISSIKYGKKPDHTPVYFKDRDMALKFDLILPAIGLETKLINYNTLLLSYQPGIAFIHLNNEPAKTYIVSQFRLAYRKFYNIDKRELNEKRTDKFSGNFVSLSVLLAASSPISPSYVTIGTTWGLQRNWGGIVHFCFEIGAGYTRLQTGSSDLGLIGDLKLGVAL